MEIHNKYTYQHLYQISSSPALPKYINIPIYKRQEKLIPEFILYKRNFLHENETNTT